MTETDDESNRFHLWRDKGRQTRVMRRSGCQKSTQKVFWLQKIVEQIALGSQPEMNQLNTTGFSPVEVAFGPTKDLRLGCRLLDLKCHNHTGSTIDICRNSIPVGLRLRLCAFPILRCRVVFIVLSNSKTKTPAPIAKDRWILNGGFIHPLAPRRPISSPPSPTQPTWLVSQSYLALGITKIAS